MNTSLQAIPLLQLAWAFLPVAAVLLVLGAWSLRVWHALYALGRMVLQLVLIGYLLVFIFDTDHASVVMIVLMVMLLAAGWIALGPVESQRLQRFLPAVVSLALGCGTTLAIMTTVVLELTPWFEPRYLIPLAGMTLANAMNTISLAAERYEAERQRGETPRDARAVAMTAAMIPVINALLAVGLVSLPGMMTGQILSGVSPLVAVRYQIMVMCMMFGGSGLSAAAFLYYLARPTTADGPGN